MTLKKYRSYSFHLYLLYIYISFRGNEEVIVESMIFTACKNEYCEEFNLLNFDIVHKEKHFHYFSQAQRRDTNSRNTFNV